MQPKFIPLIALALTIMLGRRRSYQLHYYPHSAAEGKAEQWMPEIRKQIKRRKGV